MEKSGSRLAIQIPKVWTLFLELYQEIFSCMTCVHDERVMIENRSDQNGKQDRNEGENEE